MDFHALQHKLFELDPSDPREDLAKLRAAAQGKAQENVAPTKDYLQESVDVPQGSMPLGIDDISAFAALAGVRVDEKQKMGSAGQAKGRDPMPKTSKPSSTGEQDHPLKDKLVGEDYSQMAVGDISDAIKQCGSKLGLEDQYLDMWVRYANDAFLKIASKQDRKPIGASPEQMADPKNKKLMNKARRMDDLERSASSESIKERLYRELSNFK